MYSKIQQEKAQGFSREAVARHLDLSWRTVNRYWDMNADEYHDFQKKHHRSILDKHEIVILDWLERFPDMSATQVQDRLHEHYNEIFAERTVRNYVNNLRKKHGIQKPCKNIREYGCIPELPPGQQLQADFGEYWAIREDKKRIKLYLVAFILSHSRYKHILWQTRPFTTVDFVHHLESCFEAFGGIPKELVIDQDHLMTISENFGDIIHTYDFERCKNRHGFNVWLCRKADPESKGMVECCVKFVKYNFARNRYFKDIHQWSQDCFDWLKRTGNGKVHAETKKIPAEVFATERGHLKPLIISLTSKDSSTNMVSTPVRKNNTIRYKSNRYTVPFGTYTRFQEVSIRENDGQLEIYDLSGQLLAQHLLAQNTGALVINNNHKRDTSDSIKNLMEEAITALGNTPQAESFLRIIRSKRGRYVRDQLNLIMKVAKTYEPEIIRLAILSCLDSNLDSANDFRDFADYLFRQVTVDQVLASQQIRLMPDIPKQVKTPIKVVQRQPEFYMNLITDGGK
jgi:transposase